jgi:hypothetical protein
MANLEHSKLNWLENNMEHNSPDFKNSALSKVLLIFFLIALFNCCQSEPVNENVILLDINPAKAEKLSMEKWFERIELVPLETNKESVITKAGKSVFLEGKWYINDRNQNAIFIFDEDGRFLFNTLHLSGLGPNEYGYINDFNINPETRQIEILDPSFYRIMVYDLQGNFVKKIRLKGFTTLSKFTPLTLDLYAFYSGGTDEKEGWMSLYSISEEKIIKSIAPLPAKAGKLPGTVSNEFFSHNGSVCFQHRFPSNSLYLIDTLFLDIKEYARSSFNRFTFSYSDLEDNRDRSYYLNFMEVCSDDFAFPMNMALTTDFIYQFYWFKNRLNIARLNNKTGQIDNSYFNFGFPEQIRPTQLTTGDALCDFLTPLELRYYISEALLDSKSKEVLASIDENDNPILVKYYPRK